MLPQSPPEPSQPERARGAFSNTSTVGYALFWLVLVIHGWAPLVEFDPVWWMQYPATSAERMTNRDLELAEAVDAAPRPLRELLEFIYDTRAVALETSIETQRHLIDLAEEQDLPLEDDQAETLARLHLAVLLFETEQPADAGEAITRVPDELGLALTEAYAGTPGANVAHEAEDLLRNGGLSGWYLDRVRIASARTAGDDAFADEIQAELVARGARLQSRTIGVVGTNFVLVVVGVVLVIRHARRARSLFESHAGASPWSLADGVGVFIRGDFWNRAYFIAISSLDQVPTIGPTLAQSAVGELLSTWATIFAALPLLWLMHRHLFAPSGLSALTTFGLLPKGSARGRVLRIGLAAIAIDVAGTYALAWATWGLGIDSSWAEGFDENLVWGGSLVALMTSVDYVLFAPALEELAFRGLLFFSLRHRLSPVTAALLTATFFSSMHFYTLPGFLMTLFSGFVWALAFERARSLLPGVGAHAVYNLLYVLGLVLLYR